MILENCSFNDCKVEENLLCMKNTIINHCKFNEMNALCAYSKHLIVLVDSKVMNTEFRNIIIQHGRQGCGGFIKGNNCEINEVVVEKLETRLHTDTGMFMRYLIDISEGKITNCRFNYCELDSIGPLTRTYLFNCSENVIKQNISNKNFTGIAERGVYMQNGRDSSIEEMFEMVECEIEEYAEEMW